MARVHVIPLIGEIAKTRLESMRGTHAIHERAVSKPCTSEDVGEVITECIQEIILMDARSQRLFKADKVKIIVEFTL